MKDFSLIIDKVSQALGTTVDNVVKLYPQLRAEYSWYYVLDNINEISSVIFITGAIALSFVCTTIIPHRLKEYKTPLCILICVLVLLALIYLVTLVLKGFMCPDILIIEKFIG